MKKIVFCAFIFLLILTGCTTNQVNQRGTPNQPATNTNPIVGGDRDAHGCIGSAGYSWCAAKSKCLRVWEEPCPATSTVSTAGWQAYDNAKFGFELKFPPGWAGYKVTAGDYSTYSFTAFSFGRPHQPFEIFKIVRFDEKQWAANVGKAFMRVVYQGEDLILACDGCCQANGDYAGGGQFDQFQRQRCEEGPQIIETFKMTATSTSSDDSNAKACTQEAKICPDGSSVGRTGPNCEFAPCPEKNGQGNSGGQTGIANPAAVYCEEQGGQSVIVTNSDGSQGGSCVLPNGKTCDEWEYYRGTCK